MGDRYRALQDTLRLPVGAGEALLYSRLGRRAEVVGHKDMQLLARCGRFASLHEHASRVQGPMVSATASLGDTVAQLRRLVDRGLLVSEQELLEQVRGVAVEDESPPPIESIGIPTGGRVDYAVRAIASLREAAPRDRELEIVLAHDPQEAGETQALLDAVRTLGLGGGFSLRYVGPEERAVFAQRLARAADVDAGLVQWALTRRHPDIWSVGALRNALVLDAVSTLSLQLDDDIIWELAAPPIEEPGVAFTSAGSVMELWFSAPGRGGESLVELAPGDVTAVHARMLGRRLGACLGGVEEVDLCDASGDFLREVIAGRGRIRCTQMGLVGDSATGSLAHYLMLRGKSRERLVVSEAIYDHAFASRQGARAAIRPAISSGSFCMSYALGLDGRGLLPPFVPEGRNADGVFGHVLRHCFRDSYFGYLPEVVAHRSPPRGSSIRQMLAQLRQIDVNDLLCRLVAASGLRARVSEPGHTLEVLGSHLERLGQLPLEDLEELVRTLVLRTRSRDIAMLRNTLAEHHRRPAYWARDVSSLVEHLSEVVLSAEHTHPRDLMRAYGDDEGRAGLARIVGDFGRLLCAWPALYRAAQSLRAEGVRPSRPVA